jgi:hypothetical protein
MPGKENFGIIYNLPHFSPSLYYLPHDLHMVVMWQIIEVQRKVWQIIKSPEN